MVDLDVAFCLTPNFLSLRPLVIVSNLVIILVLYTGVRGLLALWWNQFTYLDHCADFVRYLVLV